MTIIKEFKTIDQLVGDHIEVIKKFYTNFMSAYDYLICFKPKLVLSVLKSNTNIPSIHDLELIKSCINSGDIITKYKDIVDHVDAECINKILQFYKNRGTPNATKNSD